ncbi:hypothetical protein HLB35_03985 [Halomonas sp. TBZ9]|uniref:Uncharacterized protein n=1 Tax=Vreelandella azerica TaxID=2732867 RepID=A0A7Y3TVW9_9GAMM|nr:hypothetical protein [Halomonas azerica]NOG31133.1 hypothetical protein [Halomonas azerica]
MNNNQGELLSGDDLGVSLSESLSNTDGTVYAGGDVTLETGALTSTGTIAAQNDLTIDALSVDSSGTLAAGLNSEGQLANVAADGSALSITATEDLTATGTNLASGHLTLEGANIDLSESQTSADSAGITARGDLATWQANIVTNQGLSLETNGALDNTGGTLSSQEGNLRVEVLSLNNDRGTLVAGNNLSAITEDAFTNTDGTVYAGNNASLDTGALTNNSTIAAQNDLTIEASSVDSTGTLAAGLNSEGNLAEFAVEGGALDITATDDLTAIGSNLASGSLTLDGKNIDLSDSQTSAFEADIEAKGTLSTREANVVTNDNLSLEVEGAFDNTDGTLSSEAGELRLEALSLDNTDGTVYADGNTTLNAKQSIDNTGGSLYSEQGDLQLGAGSLSNTGGTVYAGNNANLDTGC